MKKVSPQDRLCDLSNAASANSALRAGEFVPFFQPLVHIRTGQLAGFEVLARWKHPELGLVLPDRFIAQAERDGWIDDFTQDLLRQVFEAAPVLPAPLTISFNISPIQLSNPGLPRLIRKAAEGTGFDLERLVLEVTESALLGNMEVTLEVARELEAMGCKLSLDDFGTDFSNLSLLQALPFAELKVDRSFVTSMTDLRRSRKIVAAVVGLGQSLGVRTVIEGIESQDQAELALWLGCDLGQGWFYGKPGPAEGLESVVRSKRAQLSVSATSSWRRSSEGTFDMSPAQRLAQLQAIYDGAPVGLGFIDRDLRYVSLNKRLADMNGASVEEHVGNQVSAMIPALYPFVEPYLRRALAGEVLEEIEVHVHSTGERRRVSYRAARDEAGEIVGVSIAATQALQRERADVPAGSASALQKDGTAVAFSNLGGLGWEGIREVLDSVSNGITLSDASSVDLPLIYTNAVFERMTGYGAEEVFGRNCRFLQGGEKDQPGLATIREALREQRPTRVVLKNFKKDGTPFWNEFYMSPIRNHDGEVTHFLGVQNDITARVELEERLVHTDTHDMLTGLPNRTQLMQRMAQALSRAKHGGQAFALLLIDLDNFKYVNDVFGHEAGDELLKAIGHRLAAFTGEYATVARLDGDEFVVVLEDLEKNESLAEVTKRLLDELQKPVSVAERILHPEASVGVAMYPRDGANPRELLRAADRAIYIKKYSRRNAD